MSLLDIEFQNFFLKTYRFIDYDEMSAISDEFEAAIIVFKQSKIKPDLGDEVYYKFENIVTLYQEKNNQLERFKTLNSRVINSINNLYDIGKRVDKLTILSQDKQALLDDFFFAIGQIIMNLPYDQKKLDYDLYILQQYSQDHKIFSYFYQHLKQFIHDTRHIKQVLHDNKEIKLDKAIQDMKIDLAHYYHEKRFEYKLITLLFFILAFMILIILIFNYRRVQKTTRELLAFRYAIENSDNAIVITDTERRIEYVNDAFEEHTGYSREEVIGKNPNILKSDLVLDGVYKNLNETLDSGKKWQGELINRRKDGTLLYEKASIVPIFLENELVQYLAIKLDITDYIKQQNYLKQSSVVYEMIGDGIIITDKNKCIVSANPAFIEIFGYSKEELLGNTPALISTLEEESVFYRKMWTQLLIHDKWSGKLHNKSKNGVVIPTWLTISIVRDEKHVIQNFIAIYTNLKEIIEMEEKAEYLAYHDSLTRLPNRAQFERQIVDILELAKVDEVKVAVLFIDLDRFKVINDTLGHHVGDGMLVELAVRIQKVLSEYDLFARIGGDEFVVIVNNIQDKVSVAHLAEEILAVIREPIEVQDYHLYTTASMGIAIYPKDGDERNEIIKHADSAMYDAKDKGKDTYQFYSKQLSLDVEARLNMEQELLHALDRKELSLHYQPQYDLRTGKIFGAEALLRWRSKHLGSISPDDFISVAEDTGVIIGIGYFVFEEACREYMRWQVLGLNINSIAINISSVQFREDDLLDRLKEIILKVGIPAYSIEIEITERFIMEYSTTNLTILEDLRNIGCRIAIDDFGTGYSSMSYMKSLALDTIKIDKSFIMDLPGDSHDAEVSKAIIALSKSLGYQVIAEGIETYEQEEFLRELPM